MAKLACICGIKKELIYSRHPTKNIYFLVIVVNKSDNNSYTYYLKNEKENGKKYKGLSN